MDYPGNTQSDSMILSHVMQTLQVELLMHTLSARLQAFAADRGALPAPSPLSPHPGAASQGGTRDDLGGHCDQANVTVKQNILVNLYVLITICANRDDSVCVPPSPHSFTVFLPLL